MQTGRGGFPTTDWGLFIDVRSGGPSAKRAALDILIRRYWRPAFLFLLQSGHENEAAKDLTQSFFASWIEDDVFGKADQGKGRFRSFMLVCLKRFVSNECRAEQIRKRYPTGGLVSLDELMDNPQSPFQPVSGMTPDMVFDRAWASAVIIRVLKHLEQECTRTGKHAHFDIFARRIINPILDGMPAPALAEIGREHGLTEKTAANHLETAKRAYRRLMAEEIRLYASTETEVAAEVRELFQILGRN